MSAARSQMISPMELLFVQYATTSTVEV